MCILPLCPCLPVAQAGGRVTLELCHQWPTPSIFLSRAPHEITVPSTVPWHSVSTNLTAHQGAVGEPTDRSLVTPSQEYPEEMQNGLIFDSPSSDYPRRIFRNWAPPQQTTAALDLYSTQQANYKCDEITC